MSTPPPISPQGDALSIERMAVYDRMPPKTRRAIAGAVYHMPDFVFLPYILRGLTDASVAHIIRSLDQRIVQQHEQRMCQDQKRPTP